MLKIVTSRSMLAIAALAALFLGSANQASALETISLDDMEGLHTAWNSAGADARHQVARHQRVGDLKQSGEASELIELTAGNGTYIYYSYSIDPVRVIDELTLSVALHANRPGMHTLARVVLPHTIDPKTKRPVTLLVHGDFYQSPGAWQTVRVADFSRKIAAQVRVLRSQTKSQVDPREAYVDRLVLNLYGGPGQTSVRIDDLQATGLVARSPQPDRQHPAWRGTPAHPASSGSSSGSRGGERRSFMPQASLSGSLLMVAGQPVLPRVIRHRGEPLIELKRIGFNVVRISGVPSRELLEQARQLGIWLLAPPPPLDELQRVGVADRFDPVIAWDLGSGLARQDLDSRRQVVDLLRAHDPRRGRPILAEPNTGLRSYSRLSDVLILGRAPLGTSFELSGYSTWLQSRALLARPGTPYWASIQTDFAPHQVAQLTAVARLTGDPNLVPHVDPLLLRRLVYVALASGSRGVCFESHGPLTADDPATRRRALMLQLVNQELQLIEPWVATGDFTTLADSNHKQIGAVALQTRRARLLLPIHAGRFEQYVPSPAARGTFSVVVPGVPESNNAYSLTPAGLMPLAHQRVTGGIRVTQQSAAGEPLVLLTSDSVAISRITQATRQSRDEAAANARELARLELDWVERQEKRIGGQTTEAIAAAMQRARSAMTSCDQSHAARDAPETFGRAQQVIEALSLIKRLRWHAAVESWPSSVSSPLACGYSTLPQHYGLAALLGRSQVGNNALIGGDFEDLTSMVNAGWQHVQYPTPGVTSSVELSNHQPRLGRYSLLMQVRPSDPANPPAQVESPPVWITTPAVRVEPGTLVRIRGWVRTAGPVRGSSDGVLIFEQQSGQAMAERIGAAKKWTAFTLYRAAPASGEVRVTFALTGVGTTWIDDVSIEPVVPAQPTATARHNGPLFEAPTWQR